jgi:hypothetical protein
MKLRTIQQDYEICDSDFRVAVSMSADAEDLIRRSTYALAQAVREMHESGPRGIPLYVLALQHRYGDVIDSEGVVAKPLKLLWKQWLLDAFGWRSAKSGYRYIAIARCLEKYEDELTSLETVPFEQLQWLGSHRNPERLEHPRAKEVIDSLSLPAPEWREIRDEIYEIKPELPQCHSDPANLPQIHHSGRQILRQTSRRRWIRGQACILTLEASDRVDPAHILNGLIC